MRSYLTKNPFVFLSLGNFHELRSYFSNLCFYVQIKTNLQKQNLFLKNRKIDSYSFFFFNILILFQNVVSH